MSFSITLTLLLLIGFKRSVTLANGDGGVELTKLEKVKPRVSSTLRTFQSSFLLSLDLIKFRQRSFKFVIEEPHRIENFAEGCRCSRPVCLSEGEHAVVAQIKHDLRVGDSVIGQVA